MDWSNSYFTMSDANIEYNWSFLKRLPRAWLAVHGAAPDAVVYGGAAPRSRSTKCWTPTRKLTHESVTVAPPLLDRPNRRLLVWTTTPVTLPANVAVAVHPQLDYAECELAGTLYYVAAGLAGRYPALGSAEANRQGYRARWGCAMSGRSTIYPSSGHRTRVILGGGLRRGKARGSSTSRQVAELRTSTLSRRTGFPYHASGSEGRYLEWLGLPLGTAVLGSAAPITAC